MQLTEQEMMRRRQVEELKLSAQTLAEIKIAQDAICAWQADYPEDLSIGNFGEVLSHAADFANEREQQGVALGLTEPERRMREDLLVRVLRIGSAQEARNMRAELLDWLSVNPADRVNVLSDLEFLDREESFFSQIEECLSEPEATYAFRTEALPEPKMSLTAG